MRKDYDLKDYDYLSVAVRSTDFIPFKLVKLLLIKNITFQHDYGGITFNITFDTLHYYINEELNLKTTSRNCEELEILINKLHDQARI